MTILVTDACSMINFAASGDMAVLKTGLESRDPRCTQAVHAELVKWSSKFPNLRPMIEEAWLGEPIELVRSQDVAGVRRIRTALGGTRSDPTLHLGEAESIHAITTRSYLTGAVFLTDDREADDHARLKRVQTWDTRRLLAAFYSDGDITWADAQAILTRMYDADRGVRIPASLAEFLA
ncbi:hypothetical protein TR51_06725 [Kitasatospora griseola]|uniref:PIN domain-containing protein n=1 Tax=Kitasatospora griseola TaxID=2064 RepID=A0A0D0Q3D5_KITGR|nr:hypothetical protein [Kitasatospora griseola]KIQ67067.1 hypothetical protein TR51_06725 [Kitasatospora griseola]